MFETWKVEPPEVKHLKWLSMLQFFYAAGALLCGTVAAYYPAFLTWTMENSPRNRSGLTPELIDMMSIVFTVYAIGIYAVAVASVVAGVLMRKRKGWLFLVILSGLDVIFVPFGTALGIGMLVTMTKPHVKDMFMKPSSVPPLL